MQQITFDKSRFKTVFKTYHITFLGMFGSYARGEARKKSDIDFLVKFSKTKSLPELVRIEREMSKIVGKKVDLLTENSISPYLKSIIQKDLKIIYEKQR